METPIGAPRMAKMECSGASPLGEEIEHDAREQFRTFETKLRIDDFGLHSNRPMPTPRVTSGDWNPIGATALSSGRCGRDDHGDDA